jgi:hypothetical protein
VTNSVSSTNADEMPVTALTKLFSEEDTNALAGAMSTFMKAALHQRIDSRIETLRTKIDLSFIQEQTLREIWTKDVEAQEDAAMKVLSGKLSEQDAKQIEQKALNVSEQIKRALTPEQWHDFQEFEKEERAGMARLVADAELAQLQEVMPLSQDTQVKVLAVFVQHAEKQFDDSQQPGGRARAMNWEHQLSAKKEAMRTVLTSNEFKTYEKHLEGQAQLIKPFLPNAKARAK